MAIPTLSLNDLAALARPVFRNVVYVNDPALTAGAYYIAGSPDTLVINMAQVFDLAGDGKFKGGAIDDETIVNVNISPSAAIAASKLATILDDPGHYAQGVGRKTGNWTARTGVPVAGDTITIGTDTFEIDRIDLDSTDDTANNDFNNVTNPLTVVLTAARGYAACGVDGTNPLLVGQLVYIGTEYLRVLSIVGTSVRFGRGRGGSTNAVHANAVGIFWSASHITGATANIPIGIQGANEAAATATPRVAATINDDDGAAAQADSVDAASLAAGAVLLLTSDDPAAVVLPTTEVAADFAWDAVVMARGAAPARKRVFAGRFTVLAGEATATVYVPVPFTPTGAVVVVSTAGAVKAWTGAVTFVGAAAPMPAYVLLTDGGAPPNLAAADTIDIVVWE